MGNMAAAEVSRDWDVEPERKNLVELISENIFGTDDWTTGAVVVVTDVKTVHMVTCGTERSTDSPANARLSLCGVVDLGREGGLILRQP